MKIESIGTRIISYHVTTVCTHVIPLSALGLVGLIRREVEHVKYVRWSST